jgi:hypothetical protein
MNGDPHPAELDKEIAILGDLIELAWRVRRSLGGDWRKEWGRGGDPV